MYAKPRISFLWLSDIGYQIRSAADRSYRYSERQFRIFGAIAVFLIPASAFVERVVADPGFDTIYLRLLASAAGLPLLFHDRLPAFIKNHIELVWIASISIILPFCYGAILTINAALTEPSAEPSSIWVYQYLVALFIFIQLSNSALLSVLLWLLMSLLVSLLCLFINTPNYDALIKVWILPLPVYLTALLIGSFTNRNMHVVQTEQLRAASAIGSNIAHELRTPLASIRALARAVQRFLPELVHGYQLAATAEQNVAPISQTKLNQLKDSLGSIQAEVDYSNTIIDMLLVNTSESKISPLDFEVFQISQAIEDAIARFPFNNSEERALLNHSAEPDFCVQAPRLFIVHVLFNLIKNGLYYVQHAGAGTLTITTQVSQQANVVTVTDTGTGIPHSLQHLIFDRFFSTIRAGQGAGIGLSFCKMVMESIGGEIQCESEEGKYTTFRLIFPNVNQ